MKSILKNIFLVTAILFLASSMSACSSRNDRIEMPPSTPSPHPTSEEESPVEKVNGSDNDKITLVTPYLNESDMATINQAFSSNNSAPWGFEHLGVDFSPKENLKPFQAVCSGTVDMIDLWQLETTSNWQVSVRLICNSTYSVIYAFEPMSSAQADGETQLENIIVSERQSIVQGEIIGYLVVIGDGSHVDFGLLENWERICPEPYFSPQAKESILSLIHIAWPGASMCY